MQTFSVLIFGPSCTGLGEMFHIKYQYNWCYLLCVSNDISFFKVEAMLFIILTLRFLKAPLDYDVLIHISADCKSLFIFQMLWVQRIAFSLVLWKRWKAFLQERLLGQIRRAVPRLQRSNRHRPHHGKQMQRLRRPSCLLLQHLM